VDKQQRLEGMRETGRSELKRKFQAALSDTQINDSKVSAIRRSAMHPTGEKLTEAAQIADR